jgi:AraC-like DNA-binding protein
MDYRVSAVIALMEKQLSQDTSLAELARSVQLSPSRLRHIFKAETEVTPAQYLKDLRMREAKKIMGAACFSVKEVMTQVGLSDRSHFERDFKKAFGLTPTQYKALCARSHLVQNKQQQNVKRNGHHLANLAIEYVLRSSPSGSNLRPDRPDRTLNGDSETIVKQVTHVLERNPTMENENINVADEQFEELFEELSVTELEDRLELAARCVCRNEN